MPLYRQNTGAMPQAAQSAMSSATNAMAHQQKQETRTITQKTSFWDDFYKAARGVAAGASAVNGIADATGKAIDLYDEIKIKGAYDDMSKVYAESGMAGLETNPDFQDYHHAQALGRIMADRAKTAKGQEEIRQNSLKIAEQNYNDTRAALMPALEAYRNGDMNKFSENMVNASNIVNMPYKLQPDGNGNFKVLFRSNEQGGWTDTGRTMNYKEAYETGAGYLNGETTVLSGMGMQLTPTNKREIMAGALRAMATNDINAAARADPSQHKAIYDANGQFMGMAIPQNTIKDGAANTYFEAYGRDGKPMGTFQANDLYSRGLFLVGAGSGGRGKGTGNAGWPAGALRAASAGGRGGRGGGGKGRGGSGANADGTPANSEYKLTQGDTSMLVKYATRIDADTGEKITDYGTVSFLAGIMRKTGLDAPSAIAAYDANVKRAMAQGASREQAEVAVMGAMQRHINGQTQQTNQQAQEQPAQPEEASTPQKTSVVDSRIRSAAGVNAPDDSDYRVPSSPAAGLGAGFSQDDMFRAGWAMNKAREPVTERINADFEAQMQDFNPDSYGYGSLNMGYTTLPSSPDDLPANSARPFGDRSARVRNSQDRIRRMREELERKAR